MNIKKLKTRQKKNELMIFEDIFTEVFRNFSSKLYSKKQKWKKNFKVKNNNKYRIKIYYRSFLKFLGIYKEQFFKKLEMFMGKSSENKTAIIDSVERVIWNKKKEPGKKIKK